MNGLSIQMDDGSTLVLFQGTTQKFLLKSILFIDTVEPPSRSFTFRIPAKPNQRFFKNFNKLDSRYRKGRYGCKIQLLGSFWKNAQLQITGFNESEYFIRLLVDRGFYAEFGQRTLRDFKYENPYMFRFYDDQLSRSEYTFEAAVPEVVSTVTFTFHITSNPGDSLIKEFTYDGGEESIEEFVKRVAEWFNARIYEYRYYLRPNPLFGTILEIQNLTTTSAPSFYFTITSSNLDFEISPPNDIHKSSLDAHRKFYSAALADSNRDAVCFPVAAPNIMSDATNYWGYLNFYNPATGQFQTTEQPFVPFPLLKYVLYTIHKEANIDVAIDQFFDEELSQIVMFNHEKINNEKRLPPQGWRYREMGVFFYQDIVPEITVSKLVNDFRFFFNTLVDYNSRSNQVSLIPVNNLLAAPEYIDWTDKLVKDYSVENTTRSYNLEYVWVGEPLSDELLPKIEENQLGESADFKSDLTFANGFLIAKATAENKYYRYQSGNWEMIAEDLYNALVEDNTNAYQTGATPLFTIEYSYDQDLIAPTVPFHVQWLLPYTKQSGNYFPEDKIEAPHRYMIYRGMKYAEVREEESDEPEAMVYPFGSSHNRDLYGNRVGNYSLAWNGDDGLMNTWYKKWLDYLRISPPVKMKFTLNADDILNLDMLVKRKVNNTLYFIDELEFEVENDITNCYATMFPQKLLINE